MACFGGLGIGLSIVIGCLILALGAEVYYLLWRKRKMAITPSPEETTESPADCTLCAKELLIQLICWKKPTSEQRNPIQHHSGDRIPNPKEDEDPELANGEGSLVKQLGGEESVESELMRLHNLVGPPRFLFTIKEETREDLESQDGRSRKGSRARSLSDVILSLDSTPLVDSYNNPLFESSTSGMPSSSPPPRFKFLRDAEEKLYRRIKEEAEARLREMQQRDSNNPTAALAQTGTAPPPSSSSQVLPLESSPTALRPAPEKKAVVR